MLQRDVAILRAAIEEHGVLLEHDVALPSVTSLLAGEAVRGSWWGHPIGERVYHALLELDDAEVLTTRLVAQKVTLVHRALFPALLAIATEDAAWQTDGLSAPARALLDRVRADGALRTDHAAPIPGTTRKPGALALELEKRLLALGRSEHTEKGAHAKVLETWARWAARGGLRASDDPAAGRSTFESRVARWSRDPRGLLPWLPGRRRA
ncbi:MAG: hypothetical protein M3Y87_29810 [Myxococcota bacterium]|nr:hypothetical protein [Myxococcota bacterium]